MLSMIDTGSLLVQILPLMRLNINYREAAWYTCTANHVHMYKDALSADDRTKAQIESAKTRLHIHSNTQSH